MLPPPAQFDPAAPGERGALTWQGAAFYKRRLFSQRKHHEFKPLHDRPAAQADDRRDQNQAGIIIPDTAQEKPMQGEVVAVGKGKRLRMAVCCRSASRSATR
jgi:hypothetical protein